MQSPPDALAERALLAAMQHGDGDALAMLYARYFRMLHHDISTMLSADDAEDVIQDVFLALCTNAKRIRVRGTVRQYLFAAVRNRARDLIARHRVRAHSETHDLADLTTSLTQEPRQADEDVLLHELTMVITRGLARLAPRCREAITHAESIRTYQELANVLGVKVSTARTLLWRARRELRIYFTLAGWTELPRPQSYHGHTPQPRQSPVSDVQHAPDATSPACVACRLRALCASRS